MRSFMISNERQWMRGKHPHGVLRILCVLFLEIKLSSSDISKKAARLPSFEDEEEALKEARWSVVMNNAHICSGHPISNCGLSRPLFPYFLTLVFTLKTISTLSLLSRPISLHIKLWTSEWPIVACCCCDIFGYIKFFHTGHAQRIHTPTSRTNQYGIQSTIARS